MALRAAIETDDDDMMQQGILRLSSLALNPYDQARFDAVIALEAERSGNLEKARSLLTSLTASPNQAVRTQATFGLAALDLKGRAPIRTPWPRSSATCRSGAATLMNGPSSTGWHGAMSTRRL
ncbi:MAG: hypothetical protein HC871_04855 [Rhizobiales bacterium]|nr:hypothetical protein [Hyphomicrobiales bacterium]